MTAFLYLLHSNWLFRLTGLKTAIACMCFSAASFHGMDDGLCVCAPPSWGALSLSLSMCVLHEFFLNSLKQLYLLFQLFSYCFLLLMNSYFSLSHLSRPKDTDGPWSWSTWAVNVIGIRMVFYGDSYFTRTGIHLCWFLSGVEC